MITPFYKEPLPFLLKKFEPPFFGKFRNLNRLPFHLCKVWEGINKWHHQFCNDSYHSYYFGLKISWSSSLRFFWLFFYTPECQQSCGAFAQGIFMRVTYQKFCAVCSRVWKNAEASRNRLMISGNNSFKASDFSDPCFPF